MERITGKIIKLTFTLAYMSTSPGKVCDLPPLSPQCLRLAGPHVGGDMSSSPLCCALSVKGVAFHSPLRTDRTCGVSLLSSAGE